jgi:hypothetical protein
MGLVEREWLHTLPLIDASDVIYLDYAQEAQRLCKVLRQEEKVDLVIALTHMRVPNDLKLGEQVSDIDIILGGHDHHYEVTPCHPNKTLMVKSGTDFRELTLLHIDVGHPGPHVCPSFQYASCFLKASLAAWFHHPCALSHKLCQSKAECAGDT